MNTGANPSIAHTIKPPGRWVDDAACLSVGTEAFYPEGGTDVAGQVREAKKICETKCPVRSL